MTGSVPAGAVPPFQIALFALREPLILGEWPYHIWRIAPLPNLVRKLLTYTFPALSTQARWTSGRGGFLIGDVCRSKITAKAIAGAIIMK